MHPAMHDMTMALVQNARTRVLEAFGSLLFVADSVRDFYDLSPPPTKILFSLLARQINPKNDEMYEAIRRYNPFDEWARIQLESGFHLTQKSSVPELAEKIRRKFGKSLPEIQDLAKKLIAETI